MVGLICVICLIVYVERGNSHDRIAANARSIHQTIVYSPGCSEGMSFEHMRVYDLCRLDARYPRAYTNSTELFTYMVTSGMMNVHYRFFNGPHTERFREGEFQRRHNEWALVQGYDWSRAFNLQFPFVLSRNITEDRVHEISNIWKNASATDWYAEKNRSVVGLMGGGCYNVTLKELKDFYYRYKWNLCTNRILHP